MITVRHGNVTHLVPCGKCGFCLTNRRSQWMFRIGQEMKRQMVPGYFLTLTYDEKHVRRTAEGRLSLRFYDIQLYLKRIRKARYYAKYVCVGEYGPVTVRPHYHMLLWTDAPVDFLASNWKSSVDGSVMGAVYFGELNLASAMYALKYIIQPKQRAVDGVEKTRAQFSKGLGLAFLTSRMYDYLTEDYENPVLFVSVDGRKVSLPRYYRCKIFTKFQLKEEQLKCIEKSIEEKSEAVRKLLYSSKRFKRVKDVRRYLQSLRVDQNDAIIKNTKHNQIL